MKDKLRDHAQRESLEWEKLCDTMTTDITALPVQVNTLETLQPLLLSRIATIPMKKSQPSRGKATGSLLGQMWAMKKEMHADRTITTSNVFRRWKQSIQLQSMRKILRKQCKLNKRALVEEKIQEATAAFQRHDPYRMYKVVRALAPKAPYQSVHIRTTLGLAQNPEDELRDLTSFFAELCKGEETHFDNSPLKAMPFEAQDLAKSIAGTPSTKSVAPGCVPGLVLKAIAEPLATWLFALLERMWCQGQMTYLPSMWRDAWVTCVPKRTVKTPKDIRPIALQCPIGKAVLRTIVRKALIWARPRLHHCGQSTPTFEAGRLTMRS